MYICNETPYWSKYEWNYFYFATYELDDIIYLDTASARLLTEFVECCSSAPVQQELSSHITYKDKYMLYRDKKLFDRQVCHSMQGTLFPCRGYWFWMVHVVPVEEGHLISELVIIEPITMELVGIYSNEYDFEPSGELAKVLLSVNGDIIFSRV